MAVLGASGEEGVSGVLQGHQEAHGLPDNQEQVDGGKVSEVTVGDRGKNWREGFAEVRFHDVVL